MVAGLSFVPLHNHSDYSLLDGATQLPAMVQRAVDLGLPAVAPPDPLPIYARAAWGITFPAQRLPGGHLTSCPGLAVHSRKGHRIPEGTKKTVATL